MEKIASRSPSLAQIEEQRLSTLFGYVPHKMQPGVASASSDAINMQQSNSSSSAISNDSTDQKSTQSSQSVQSTHKQTQSPDPLELWRVKTRAILDRQAGQKNWAQVIVNLNRIRLKSEELANQEEQRMKDLFGFCRPETASIQPLLPTLNQGLSTSPGPTLSPDTLIISATSQENTATTIAIPAPTAEAPVSHVPAPVPLEKLRSVFHRLAVDQKWSALNANLIQLGRSNVSLQAAERARLTAEFPLFDEFLKSQELQPESTTSLNTKLSSKSPDSCAQLSGSKVLPETGKKRAFANSESQNPSNRPSKKLKRKQHKTKSNSAKIPVAGCHVALTDLLQLPEVRRIVYERDNMARSLQVLRTAIENYSEALELDAAANRVRLRVKKE